MTLWKVPYLPHLLAFYRIEVFLLEIDSHTFSFSLRMVVTVSTVFLANRDIDFVRIRSTCPSRQSEIIWLNPARREVVKPEMPSSTYGAQSL